MDDITNNPRITPLDIEQEMKKSFISYAMAVIINRALPDVRDGLKPVHRRILYSMGEQGFTPDKPFHKSARIVGDVLGKYHPHGDSSVYDAMVRLAQDFNTRYLLIEGQGNFGSVDGDGAAAMRYTEARLSKMSLEMLADIDKSTVDFGPNFDETLTQPLVLPSRFPNLLVNGSNGIAVGMATNVPPHNLGEVIDAYVALIDNRDISIEELMAYLPGPDFPTGATIMGTAGIRQAYRTGRGKILVRAKTEIEPMANGKSRIVVTELPYQVNKARLVEKIAELVHEKRVEGITALRDESNRNGMKVVIEIKKDVNANVVLNQLYKHTQLQDTFGVIMLALVDGEPKVLNIKEMLYHYLRFQEEVVTRRTKHDLEKAKERLHILEGLLIAMANIDEVVDIIKTSKTQSEAKERLNVRFGLTDKQSQAILDMRLGRLTGLEHDKIQAERDGLVETIAYYESVLADENKLLGIIREEILEVRRKYADPRRTEIAQITEDIELAKTVVEACEEPVEVKFLYDLEMPLRQRVELIAKEVYGADGVDWAPLAVEKAKRFETDPKYKDYCTMMVKTHLSLSDDPSKKGVPTGWRLAIRDILEYGGAKFLCPMAGTISMMPGTAANPAYRRIDVDTETGKVSGLF